ncbi:MAG: 3-oxoacyl-[acyl-carrier-protein] reductase [Alkalispirochaeta sp.]
MLIDGKVALVTGGSRGIGRQIVETFLQNGAVVHSFSRSAGEDISRLQETYGNDHLFHHAVDVGDEDAVTQAVKAVFDQSGRVDVLVNNAGITRDGLIMRMSSEDWRSVMDVNLASAFYTSKAVTRPMIKQRSGSIINITSVVGLIGNAGQANYAASKAGLVGLTKSMAREVAGRNVRVNAIAPGFIETEMTDRLNEEQRETLQSQIPMGRIGSAEEIAKVCVFLASDMASYITGEVITVGGGLAM